MGMGFQCEQHRLGLWDLSWDLKKTIPWEMGLGPPPPSRPSYSSPITLLLKFLDLNISIGSDFNVET